MIKDANITINIRDMDKSISFYQSLGFALTHRWENHFAELSVSGMKIGLHTSNNENGSGGSGNVSIGFTTENIDESKSFLQKLSIPVAERQEEGGQFLHFTDPDGTALYFIKPKW